MDINTRKQLTTIANLDAELITDAIIENAGISSSSDKKNAQDLMLKLISFDIKEARVIIAEASFTCISKLANNTRNKLSSNEIINSIKFYTRAIPADLSPYINKDLWSGDTEHVETKL